MARMHMGVPGSRVQVGATVLALGMAEAQALADGLGDHHGGLAAGSWPLPALALKHTGQRR
eukprot:210949-Chlamydomonas_euryale.AAC.5